MYDKSGTLTRQTNNLHDIFGFCYMGNAMCGLSYQCSNACSSQSNATSLTKVVANLFIYTVNIVLLLNKIEATFDIVGIRYCMEVFIYIRNIFNNAVRV